jgi:hypothetical protein
MSQGQNYYWLGSPFLNKGNRPPPFAKPGEEGVGGREIGNGLWVSGVHPGRSWPRTQPA